MIVVTGHVRVAPENIEAVRPHARAMLEASRREGGCILYAYGEDIAEPGLIRVVERWENWDSLDAHLASSHIKTWRAALKEIGVLDREVTAHAVGETRAL